jgi:hypothetical protein
MWNAALCSGTVARKTGSYLAHLGVVKLENYKIEAAWRAALVKNGVPITLIIDDKETKSHVPRVSDMAGDFGGELSLSGTKGDAPSWHTQTGT